MKKIYSKMKYNDICLFIEWEKPFSVTQISFWQPSGKLVSTKESEEFIRKFKAFMKGERLIDLLDYMDFGHSTGFQRNILECLWKNIPRGKVMSYGKLAELAGCPGGARAVGNAMNKNPFPVLIPCHRVVKSDLSLGGFAPGKKLKIQLLELEGIKLVNQKIPRQFQFKS